MERFQSFYSKGLTAICAISRTEFLTGHDDGAIRLWELDVNKNGNREPRFQREVSNERHTKSVCWIDLMPEGRFFSVSRDEKTLRIWDLDTLNCSKSIDPFQYVAESFDIVPLPGKDFW